jgi:hypothetical protein
MPGCDYPFDELSTDANDLYHSTTIDRISRPDALFFYREYVAKNKPCIITGCIDHWPALFSWSNAYLEKLIGDETVTVAMTPNVRHVYIYLYIFIYIYTYTYTCLYISILFTYTGHPAIDVIDKLSYHNRYILMIIFD